MSTTARHKKPGGFRKLVNSLETTPEERRQKILDIFRTEDPVFAQDVEGALFFFEEFKGIADMMIAEVIFAFKFEMGTVALALFKCRDEELLLKFVKNMTGVTGSGFREATSLLDKVTVGSVVGARFRIIEKARELQQQNRILIKRYSDKYLDAD